MHHIELLSPEPDVGNINVVSSSPSIIMNVENSDPQHTAMGGSADPAAAAAAAAAAAEHTNGITKAARVFGNILSNDDVNVQPNKCDDYGSLKQKPSMVMPSNNERTSTESASSATSTGSTANAPAAKGKPDKTSAGSTMWVTSASSANDDKNVNKNNNTDTSAVSESDSLSYSPSPLIERLQLTVKTTTPRDLSFGSAKSNGKDGVDDDDDDDEVASASGRSSSSAGIASDKRLIGNNNGGDRRNLVAKTQQSITHGDSNGSGGSFAGGGGSASVNQSINAARSAKQSHLLTYQSKMAKIRSERQNQKLDAATFHAEAERMRREALAMQRQLSAKFAKARAQREAAIKADRLNAITREVEFKASVFRDHQASNKELENRRRRKSSQVKSVIWAERRTNTEQMRLDRIEEDRAWMEERNLGSMAAREYARSEAETRRQSLAFRNAEGRRIREEAEQQRAEELHGESQSIQLKLAGERDADAYRRQMAEERRQSHEFRHQEAFRQREEAEQRRAEEVAAESASIQLKLAGERDADDYRRQMAEERRQSYAFRNAEVKRHRDKFPCCHIHLLYGFETEHFLSSLLFDNFQGRRIREEEDQVRAEEAAAESDSIQLKLAAERDADDYRRQMAEERRQSYAYRNEEGRRQREEEEQQRIDQVIDESESIQLKLAAERDADAYRRQMAARKRASLQYRNKEGRIHRMVEANQRSGELNQRHVDSKLRSLDAASVELARQKEKAQRALFELEHQGRLKPFGFL